MQKIHPLGSSYAMIIPKAWFNAHGLKPEDIKELLIVADLDIRIVNPSHEEKVYKEVSEITKKVEF